MAVGKSVQLARSLRSMSTRIPYEDVKAAAKDIATCLSNVLTVRFSRRCFRDEYRNVGSHDVIGGQRAIAAKGNCVRFGFYAWKYFTRRL